MFDTVRAEPGSLDDDAIVSFADERRVWSIHKGLVA